jgi:hypothetical protein
MGDEDLSAIRAKRMAELQARGGVVFKYSFFDLVYFLTFLTFF